MENTTCVCIIYVFVPVWLMFCYSLLDEPDFNLLVKQAPVPGRGFQRAYDANAFFRYTKTSHIIDIYVMCLFLSAYLYMAVTWALAYLIYCSTSQHMCMYICTYAHLIYMYIYTYSPVYRWHTVIVPRLGSGAMAGFELGSGIFSNSHIPEKDAEQLRNVDI